ncbi:MAG: IS982 family transposase [Rickettsiales bacterium]|nr:MAG: IS982 family transposase [Rickettsiales bacterium]
MKKCIITIYYLIDNFCKEYKKWEQSKLLPVIGKRDRARQLSLSELLTVVLYFYLSPCRDFKNYYLYFLPYKCRGYFKLVSYSRIVQLMPRLILPLSIIMQNLYGDKGYISKKLFTELFKRGLKIFTGIRKDMHNHLLSNRDRYYLQKRVLVESVFNVLKNSINLEHTRHRSPLNFIVHVLACVTGFSLFKSINKTHFFHPNFSSLS